MATTWLIDGYNLLHRVYPSVMRSATLEESRRFLEEELARFARSAAGARIVLVFDGRAESPARRTSRHGFQVVFSRAPETADDVLIDLARRHEGGGGDVCVVTTDLRDIGYRISGLHCRHMTSEEFAAEVGRTVERLARGGSGAPSSNSGEKPGSISGAEAEGWLREFGLGPASEEEGEEGAS